MGYQFSYDKVPGYKFGIKNLNWDVFEKKLKNWKIEKNLKKNYFLIFSSIFKSFKSPASRKENVRFPNSPDFENLPDFRTGRDVQ